MHDGASIERLQGHDEAEALGCPKCRWAVRGCGRCRALSPAARRIKRQKRELGSRLGRRGAAANAPRGPAQLKQNNSQTGPSKRCFPAEAPAASKAQSQTGACAAPPAKFRRVEQEASPVPGKQAFAAATGSVRQREGPEAAPLPGPDGPPPSKFRRVQPSGSCSPSHGTVSSGSTSTAPPPSPAHAAPAADFRKKLEVGMEEARKRRLSGKSDTSHPSPLSPPLKRMCKGPGPASPRLLPEDPRVALWHPPISPYGLLEEELYPDPWKLLVACMLLNKTTSRAVRSVIWTLFDMCPGPLVAAVTHVARIQALIQPLGLANKRAEAIQRLSWEYAHKDWRDPQELHGVGRYGADAYHMFCRGLWREVEPEDKDLRRYRDWLLATGGQGMGFQAEAGGGGRGGGAAGSQGPERVEAMCCD
ncbi:hypothetical protein ACKKBG_A03885 [Auxenochlorella protothecoides x Auxenochlorella symbiontica]